MGEKGEGGVEGERERREEGGQPSLSLMLC